MAETAKLKPEINGRGLFLPWPFVLACMAALLLSVIVPLWVGAVHAMHVAGNVDALVENDKEQDRALRRYGETIVETRARVAALEARK